MTNLVRWRLDPCLYHVNIAPQFQDTSYVNVHSELRRRVGLAFFTLGFGNSGGGETSSWTIINRRLRLGCAFAGTITSLRVAILVCILAKQGKHFHFIRLFHTVASRKPNFPQNPDTGAKTRYRCE